MIVLHYLSRGVHQGLKRHEVTHYTLTNTEDYRYNINKQTTDGNNRINEANYPVWTGLDYGLMI